MGGAPPYPSTAGLEIPSGSSPVVVQSNIFGLGVSNEDRGLAGRAIEVEGDGSHIGGANPATGPLLGNAIGNMAGSEPALALDGAHLTVVQGNFIGVDSDGLTARPNDSDGILVYNGASDNTVGGDELATANTVSNSAAVTATATAIKVTNAVRNLIIGNHGAGNAGGPFIDLAAPLGPGNDAMSGAQNGIQAPVITSQSGSGASGTALPNADVRLYTASDATPQNAGAYLGQAFADPSGHWTVNATIPNVPFIGATQSSSTTLDTSELGTFPVN